MLLMERSTGMGRELLTVDDTAVTHTTKRLIGMKSKSIPLASIDAVQVEHGYDPESLYGAGLSVFGGIMFWAIVDSASGMAGGLLFFSLAIVALVLGRKSTLSIRSQGGVEPIELVFRISRVGEAQRIRGDIFLFRTQRGKD